MDFRSNGKMAEHGSGNGLNGGKIDENWEFQPFFSNTLVEKLLKYLIIIDIGTLKTRIESVVKWISDLMEKWLKSAQEMAKMMEKLRKIYIFRRFSQICWMKSNKSILLSLIKVPYRQGKKVL